MRRTVLLSAALGLGLLAAPAAAQPKLPPPTLQRVLADSIVGKSRVRWSRGGAGGRVEVSIGVGAAQRLNPQWSPEPVRLRYDLNQNQSLERELRRAVPSLRPQGEASLPAMRPQGEAPRREPGRREAGRLGPSTAAGVGPEDRTLELLARGAEGWVVVGSWSMPAARWRRQHGALFRLLEPLFEAPPETFVPFK